MKPKEDQMGLVLPPSFFKKERRQRKPFKKSFTQKFIRKPFKKSFTQKFIRKPFKKGFTQKFIRKPFKGHDDHIQIYTRYNTFIFEL